MGFVVNAGTGCDVTASSVRSCSQAVSELQEQEAVGDTALHWAWDSSSVGADGRPQRNRPRWV